MLPTEQRIFLVSMCYGAIISTWITCGRVSLMSPFTQIMYCFTSGYVNSQNARLWSSKNPHEFKETYAIRKSGCGILYVEHALLGLYFSNKVNSVKTQAIWNCFYPKWTSTKNQKTDSRKLLLWYRQLMCHSSIWKNSLPTTLSHVGYGLYDPVISLPWP